MFLNDYIQVAQAGFARLRTRTGAIIAGRDFDEKSVIEVKGWVNLVCRERGKIVPGTSRKGFNIWTNTGREYVAMLMAVKNNVEGTLSYYRSDRMAYIGVGTGSQMETPNVVGLVEPKEFVGGSYLAPLDLPDFPLYPTRTTVRFHRTFLENQITLNLNSRVSISEMGLFTNGDPASNPPFLSPVDNDDGRSTAIGDAAIQAPMAYKTFEPIGKTDAMQLEVSWEIRL